MKPLENETNLLDLPLTVDETALLLAETVPLVMRTIRDEMREQRSDDLSVPQFRTLLFIRRHPGASLSEVAEHIGLTLPSISKMMDRLVARDFVARRSAPDDRRRICLELTDLGQSTLKSSSEATRDHLANSLAALSPDERENLVQALDSLRRVFGTNSPR